MDHHYPPRRLGRWIGALLLVAFAQVAWAGDLSGQQNRPEISVPTHPLWLVSTRQASSCPGPVQTNGLQYYRCDSVRGWTESSLGELLSTDDPDTTTLVYVHENRVTRAEAFNRASIVCRQVARFVPAGKPFRFIALSWPSDRIGGPQRNDVLIKARRCEAHAYYLAWLLDQIHPNVPISLFGDSFGPRMITAALHGLAGGSMQGRRLSTRTNLQRRPVRVVLMSAALDSNGLSKGQRYGLALTQVEHMLITVNAADEALKWYPKMNGLFTRGPGALGFTGVSCLPTEHAGKVLQWNVRSIAGKTHSWKVYEGSAAIMRNVVPHLFGS